MKDSHYRISLDIHSTQSQVSLPVKQGDTSRKVFISLCEGGKPYQIEEDCYAVFSAKKPDGTLIENYCIIAGNVIEYTFTEQTTAVGGMLNCEIKLYGGDSGLITSPRFTIIVDTRVVSDAEVESTSEYSALTNLYTTTTAAITRAEKATDEAIDAKEKTETVKEETQAVKEATEAVKTEVETKLANGEFKGEKGDKGDPADYNLVSNALKGSDFGNTVRLDDVSPVEHEMKVKVSDPSAMLTRCGKNLVTNLGKSTEGSGIEWTLNEDGTVTANGTAATQCVYSFEVVGVKSSLIGKTVTLSGCPEGGGIDKYSVCQRNYGQFDTGNSKTFTITNNNHASWGIRIEKGITVSNLVFKPQLEVGFKTEYEPCVEPVTYNGTVDSVTSLYPTTTLLTDTDGATIDVEYNRDANNVIAELISLIQKQNRISYINLVASKWQGSASPYSQVVAIDGATKNSFVEFCFSTEQIETFKTKDITFTVKNDNGVITVNCVGQKPTADYRLQVKITEVQINE